MIHLIGPGGAGKSTTGPIVADLLRCPFYDLDRIFETRHGNIDELIRLQGYDAYARLNVETYCVIVRNGLAVLATSSGFMTYPADTHPDLLAIHQAIAEQPSTFVLLPSLDLEECVSETLRRQRVRPLAQHRTDGREEAVIRERFPTYMALPAKKIPTMRPPAEIAAEIVTLLDFDHSMTRRGKAVGGEGAHPLAAALLDRSPRCDGHFEYCRGAENS